MKRKDEETARLALDRFLRAQPDNPVIVWEDVVKDPPDYNLYLDGQLFAVEVTQIMETREKDSEKLTLLEAVKFLQNLAKAVEKQTMAYLSGGYLLFCHAPLTNLLLLKQERKQLNRRMVEYIRATQTLSVAPETTIFQQAYHEIITITKVTDTVKEIRVSSIDFMSMEGIAFDICRQVESSLIEKNRKLSSITCPKIVLLYDSYGFHEDGFGDIDKRKNCISQLKSVFNEFHTVFWVPPIEEGFVLYSVEHKWN